MNKKLRWCLLIYIFIASLLTLTFVSTSWIFYQRIGAFGCFDQCFNYVAAFFMLKGKTLYSQIFFNHQPLMAYLSYTIQAIFHPKTLYQLVLYHRVFVILFSFLMDLLIIFRFRWPGIGFVLFYETTKYYLFGNFFLPEALIVYPLAYLFGLVWYKWQRGDLSFLDYILSAAFSWFIIFLREPLIPVTLLIYATILWQKKIHKLNLFSLFIFSALSLLILLMTPLPDYLFNVAKVNFGLIENEAEKTRILGLGVLKVFLYPFHLLLEGKWSYLRIILIGLDTVFLSLIIVFIARLKKYKEVCFIFLILGFSSFRYVIPGTMFYEAFHLLPWFGLFIMAIFLLLAQLYTHRERYFFYLCTFSLMIIFAYLTLSPKSFFWEKIDREAEFTGNYAHYYVYGEVVRILSDSKDTLFLDAWDDLIYWQAGLDSSYQYSLYTPVMSNFPKYRVARDIMFEKNPPTFYYYPCAEEMLYSPLLPKYKANDYQQLHQNGKPTCLYIEKAKLSQITEDQRGKIGKLGFYLP